MAIFNNYFCILTINKIMYNKTLQKYLNPQKSMLECLPIVYGFVFTNLLNCLQQPVEILNISPSKYIILLTQFFMPVAHHRFMIWLYNLKLQYLVPQIKYFLTGHKGPKRVQRSDIPGAKMSTISLYISIYPIHSNSCPCPYKYLYQHQLFPLLTCQM